MKKWYGLTIFLTIALDRLVKLWAERVLPLQDGNTIALIKDVFHLTYVQNRGAAFGMMQNQFVLFYIITAALVLYAVWTLFIRKPAGKGFGLSLALLTGGALGNFYDRIAYGYVIDLFDFRLINFAVFNVADMAICVGVGLIALFYILYDMRITREKKAQETAQKEAEDADAAVQDQP